MKLKKLLKQVPIPLFRGNKEIEITGLTCHSKKVSPGNLFVAKKGAKDDGSKYIEEAISAGAHAILSDMGDPFLKGVAQLVHPNIKEIEGKLASSFYENPSRELFTIGVTGTCGKTTTTYLIKHLFDSMKIPCGLLGTNEYIRGRMRSFADRTTLDVISNHKFLREMVSEGCQAAALEVTSHALEQGRVNEIDFDVAVFTNLSQDHLDYHQTMENYAAAKSRLFEMLKPAHTALINGEDPFASIMVKNCKAKVLTYGFSSSNTLYADEISLKAEGMSFTLHYQNQKARFTSSLIGRYNLCNLLSAIGVALIKNCPLDSLVLPIQNFSGVRGRLERVGQSNIFVDFAHTPDALEKVLTALQEFKKGKIIVCFGCGGDRDRTKRPLMAKIVEELSDHAVVTSDNPRTENPSAIIDEIVTGFRRKNYTVEVDRALAIKKAISLAKSEDLVLIAGKGHETTQSFAQRTIPFDDREVAHHVLKGSVQ